MYPRQVTDNLLILGNDYFQTYLIKGKSGCALVETGISATVDITLQHLSKLGTTPDYLIVTHPHSDHVTGLDYLKNAFPHAAVIAGKGAESFLTHPKAAQSLIMEDNHMIEAMTSRGLCSRRPAIEFPPSLSGCKVVKNEEELNLGNFKIYFLEVEGHSPGNILVVIPSIKTVLVSDSLGNHYPGRGFFPTFFTGFTDYMKTIDRLEKLNPIILGLAHNGLFTNLEEIRNIFQKSRKAADGVYKYIFDDTRSDEDVAKDLFGFYYTGELAIYSPQNILSCCRLLVRRVREILTSKTNRSKN